MWVGLLSDPEYITYISGPQSPCLVLWRFGNGHPHLVGQSIMKVLVVTFVSQDQAWSCPSPKASLTPANPDSSDVTSEFWYQPVESTEVHLLSWVLLASRPTAALTTWCAGLLPLPTGRSLAHYPSLRTFLEKLQPSQTDQWWQVSPESCCSESLEDRPASFVLPLKTFWDVKQVVPTPLARLHFAALSPPCMWVLQWPPKSAPLWQEIQKSNH